MKAPLRTHRSAPVPLTENQSSLCVGHTGLCPWKTWTICAALRRHARPTEAGVPCTSTKPLFSPFRGPTGARSGYEPPAPRLRVPREARARRKPTNRRSVPGVRALGDHYAQSPSGVSAHTRGSPPGRKSPSRTTRIMAVKVARGTSSFMRPGRLQSATPGALAAIVSPSDVAVNHVTLAPCGGGGAPG